jgi:hypothetical protein
MGLIGSADRGALPCQHRHLPAALFEAAALAETILSQVWSRAESAYAPRKRIGERDSEPDLELARRCGAEPIHENLAAFADKFASVGFRRRRSCCYGMAESTLAILFSKVTPGFHRRR